MVLARVTTAEMLTALLHRQHRSVRLGPTVNDLLFQTDASPRSGLLLVFGWRAPDAYPAGNKSGIDLNDRDGVAIQRRVIPKMQR